MMNAKCDTEYQLSKTLEERNIYGDYASKAECIQGMKEWARDSPKWDEMTPDKKESIEMIIHKMSRILYGDPNHIDSWHDIQGYAKLIEDKLRSE